MCKVKRIFVVSLLSIFILINTCLTVYATSIKVTDENLQNAFQEFVKSDANSENYSISVSNNIINITVDNKTYPLNYDLTDKPTFTYTIPVSKGMSYKDFKEQTDNLILPMLGYIAVANIEGVNLEDASSYFLLSYLSNLSGSYTIDSNSYMIIDDTEMSEGVTIEREDDSKTIYASEFGERVIEYVNDIYKDKQTFSDSDDLNSYTWTVEKTDSTEDSCKLVSKLIVNTDADFSQINGFEEKASESFLNNNITEENADYLIKLKVGQECKIECNDTITGYETSGSSCIEFSEDKTLITAKNVGKANGYLYIGNNNEKKSIYVIVEENKDNLPLEQITLKIETSAKEKDTENPQPQPTNIEEKKEDTKKEQPKDDTTINKTRLPQTGINNSVVILLIISVICTFTIVIKLKKYKDIK